LSEGAGHLSKGDWRKLKYLIISINVYMKMKIPKMEKVELKNW